MSPMQKLWFSGLCVVVAVAAIGSIAEAKSDPATETVLICTLTEVAAYPEHEPSKRTSIQQEFVLKFDDHTQTVTYVGGPFMTVTTDKVWKSEFENQIVFSADSPPMEDGAIIRESGIVSRLTGKIQFAEVLVKNGVVEQAGFNEMKYGTCAGGVRKF